MRLIVVRAPEFVSCVVAFHLPVQHRDPPDQ
jgi:hypothetical protein